MLSCVPRVFVVVIDALGVGALPDASTAYGDPDTVNTLGGVDASVPRLHLPAMAGLGLGHLGKFRHLPAVASPQGAYGKLAERSCGKDTTTGHWEMMGQVVETPFPTYPQGFPNEVIEAFLAATGCAGVLGNCTASGTTILDTLGPQHQATGWPIVYTSADSVFQIAAHVDSVPLAQLYAWCEAARHLLRGPHAVARVIARPFTGAGPGAYTRLGAHRHDYALPPAGPTVLDRVREAGALVVAVGKINDIFCGHGVTHAMHTDNNAHGLDVWHDLTVHRVPLNQLCVEGKPRCDYPLPNHQFIFINLVDTDMCYGHRRDPVGYGQALEAIDAALMRILPQLGANDLLILTGDHGCDPTAPGTDHTREYVPILLAGPRVRPQALGIRDSFADVGQTVLAWLGFSGHGLAGQPMAQALAPPASAIG
jgi:phosphopentomutase